MQEGVGISSQPSSKVIYILVINKKCLNYFTNLTAHKLFADGCQNDNEATAASASDVTSSSNCSIE